MDEQTGTYLFSEPAQYEAFKATPPSEPILMLNLVRLRSVAQYASDHPDRDKNFSGPEAYKIYCELIAPIFTRAGGRQTFFGVDGFSMIGPPGDDWDCASVNEYPSVAAFLEMMRDPDYRSASKHRQAAVSDVRTLRFLSGASFLPAHK